MPAENRERVARFYEQAFGWRMRMFGQEMGNYTIAITTESEAFLAPSIIEQIAQAQQPPQLTAQALSTRRGDLPLSWRAQRELLGFALS